MQAAPLYYIDRETGTKKKEKVFGASFLYWLYGGKKWQKAICELVSRAPFFSWAYGWWQRQPWTRSAIAPFIKKFGVDPTEFETEHFVSFDDFFTRRLKSSARPISSAHAIIPADGRYLFYPIVEEKSQFQVKGQPFDLSTFLGDKKLAQRFFEGTMVIARLCPYDYHRFFFPVTGNASAAHLIKGALYSVNPYPLSQQLSIFWKNKRMLTLIDSDHCGQVAMIEVGATNVGTIHQEYEPSVTYLKGSEKGFFSFGGSSIVLLFEPGKLTLAEDLLPHQELEVFCKLGQPLSQR